MAGRISYTECMTACLPKLLTIATRDCLAAVALGHQVELAPEERC